MSTKIYYFSGTGNSFHVAKELQKRLPDAETVSMLSLLNSSQRITIAETAGLVFPIHNLSLPEVVKRFLQQVDIGAAGYLFAVTTRFCSDKVFQEIDRNLEKQGKSLDAYFSVEMPCTYTPLFRSPSKEQFLKMEYELQKKLDEIAKVVLGRRSCREKDNLLMFLVGHILYPVISAYMEKMRFPGMVKSFYADSRCTGCGLCEDVCLSGKVRMKDNRPEWDETIDCFYCFSCLHFCPVEAIQLKGRDTLTKGRYHHPEISATEISAQKERVDL